MNSELKLQVINLLATRGEPSLATVKFLMDLAAAIARRLGVSVQVMRSNGAVSYTVILPH